MFQNNKIKALEKRIEQLEADQKYFDFWGGRTRNFSAIKLTAQEIASRFQEIYEILGFERTTFSECTVLKKKPIAHKGKK